jgi:hypothetical protein
MAVPILLYLKSKIRIYVINKLLIGLIILLLFIDSFRMGSNLFLRDTRKMLLDLKIALGEVGISSFLLLDNRLFLKNYLILARSLAVSENFWFGVYRMKQIMSSILFDGAELG